MTMMWKRGQLRWQQRHSTQSHESSASKGGIKTETILIKNNSIKDRFKTVMWFFPTAHCTLLWHHQRGKKKELAKCSHGKEWKKGWRLKRTLELIPFNYRKLTLSLSLTHSLLHIFCLRLNGEQFILRVIHSKLMQLVPKWNAINNNFPFYNTSAPFRRRRVNVLSASVLLCASTRRVDMKGADKWICIYC